jgi:mono/diheme cytochrome c family protein
VNTRLATLLLAGAVTVAGCAQAPSVPLGADGEPDAVLQLGQDIYGRRCAACHGADGGGGRGSKLNDGALEEAYPTIDDLVVVIVDGQGSTMPGFGESLSAGERLALARYIIEVLN